MGYGTFNIKKQESIGTKTELGFVAGGTGIAPCLALIYACLHKNDSVNLSLIFANLREEDIVLKKEIDQLAKNYPKRFRVHYTVDRESSGHWKGSVGHITQNMLAEHMPAPGF